METSFAELGLESLKLRKSSRPLQCMFKTLKDQAPEHLNNLILKRKQKFNTRNKYVPGYNYRTEFFLFLLPPLKSGFTLVGV